MKREYAIKQMTRAQKTAIIEKKEDTEIGEQTE